MVQGNRDFAQHIIFGASNFCVGQLWLRSFEIHRKECNIIVSSCARVFRCELSIPLGR